MKIVEPQVMAVPTLDRALNTGSRVEEELPKVSTPTQAGPEGITTPRKVILADFNRLMAEIEASSLMQEELSRNEPQLASTASFLEIISGSGSNKIVTEEVSGETTGVAVDITVSKVTHNSVGDATDTAGVAADAGVAVIADISVATG